MPLFLASCATMEDTGKSFSEQIRKAGIAVADAASQAQAKPQSQATNAAPTDHPVVPNPIRGTELDDLFKKNPITNSKSPETWPRVALTIKQATKGVMALSGPGTLTADDCVTFDLKVWKSAKDGKAYSGLRMCTQAMSKEAEGVAFRNLNLMPMFTFPTGNTTAAQRTEGPTPPFHVFPQDIRSQQAWVITQQNSIYYIGGILRSLGYDWDNDFDRRLWVVSVPLTANSTPVGTTPAAAAGAAPKR